MSTGFFGNALVFDPYCAGILQGVFTIAEQRDYSLTLFTRPWESEDQNGHWLNERIADGMILVAPSIHTDLIRVLSARGMKMVAVSADAQSLGIPTVDVDNDNGTTLATEHLISLGHRHIAHLAGTLSQTSAFIRRDAFYRVMTKHGLSVPDNYIVEAGYSFSPAYAHAARLLKSPNPPTAIFAANDHIALNTIEAARDLGLSVPGDLSIVGYDDNPVAATSYPALTTVRQPLGEMGRMATELLIHSITDQPIETRTYLLPAELIVRETTAPPPSL